MKKILAILLFSASLFAANNVAVIGPAQARIAPDPDFQTTFNNLQSIPPFRKFKVGTVLREAHTSLICVYDFATQGGAIGNINLLSTDLKTPCALPGKAVVRNGFVDITTALVSVGVPSIAFSTGQTANDLHVPNVSPNLVAVGQFIVSPVFATLSTYVKLNTANTVVNGVNANVYQPYMTIGLAALTGGHLRLFIDYSISE